MSIAGQKRTQHCTSCKNHGFNIPKKGHHCPHLNCPCLLCKLTKKAQMAMRHQQRVWRHQKQKLKSLKFDDEDSNAPENKTNKSQACDKCRNHSVLKLKRNHQCPYQNCQCEYCSLTFKRREIMKHQQRVRRSKITSKVKADDPPIREETEDNNEYSYYKNEGAQTAGKPSSVSYTDDEDSNGGKSDVHPDYQERYEVDDHNVNKIPMDALRLRSLSEESDHVPYQKALVHPTMDSLEEMKPRESPPPLIHMSNHSSPIQLSSRSNRSVSPPPQNHFDHVLRRETPSPPRYERDSSPLRFDSSHESSREGSRQTSPLMFARGSSSSTSPPFRPFPFTPSQPLQSLSALNASLEPSMNSIKFGSHLEELHLRNCNWLPPTLIGSSFGRMHHSSFLHAPQPNHLHHRLHTAQQPIRPLPLNVSHTRHPAAFPQELWNHMFLPFNLGLQQNIPDSRFQRFPAIVGSSRFSSSDIFHSA